MEASFLVEQFRNDMVKLKDPRMDEAVFDVAYSTGFLGLDFLNGIVVHVKSATQNFKYNSIGVLDGSATTVIGRPGCGKSTLLLQIGSNIIRQFKTAALYHDDIEGGMADARKEVLTGMDPTELQRRYIYRNSGITAENFYQRIKVIHDIKISNKAKFEYDTGLYDTKGDRIFKLEPTVYIIDSIPMLMPEKITEEDELSGQMSATSGAKVNTRIFKQIVPMLKVANIIVLCINHILDDVNINPMQRSKAQTAYLKQGERLPGGRAAIYLANNMFRMDDSAKLKETEGLGIDGSIVDLNIVKSRTNKSGKSIPLVFNTTMGGFDALLSMFQFLKAQGKITAKGAYMSLEGSEIKFTQKMFKTKMHDDPVFREDFARACNTELIGLLSTSKDSDTDSLMGADVFELNSFITNYKAS